MQPFLLSLTSKINCITHTSRKIMTKYLTLTLLLSIATITLSDQSTKPEQNNSAADNSIVKLTEYEKIVRDRIISFWGSDLGTNDNKELLLLSCGIYMFNSKDSYNRNDHPKCEDTLKFLKYYAEETDRLNNTLAKESKEKLNQLWDHLEAKRRQHLGLEDDAQKK